MSSLSGLSQAMSHQAPHRKRQWQHNAAADLLAAFLSGADTSRATSTSGASADDSGTGAEEGPAFASTTPPWRQQHQPQAPAVNTGSELQPLSCSLEELFRGAVKRVTVALQRREPAATGGAASSTTVLQQLQVCVQPGLQEGARITLGLGRDVTFVIQQQLHPEFRRLGNDLYSIVTVPLVTALTGGPVMLRTLDGSLLQLPLHADTIITPNSELVVANQGMPVFGDSTGRRGALHVRFRVAFPSHLTRQQQQLLRAVLLDLDEQQQQHHHLDQAVPPMAVAAAAAVLLPRPQAGLRSMLLPAAADTAAQQPWHPPLQPQQQHDEEHALCAVSHRAPSRHPGVAIWCISPAGRDTSAAAGSYASSIAGFGACMQSTGSSSGQLAPGDAHMH